MRLGGRRGVLVKYMRYDFVEAGVYDGLNIFVNALESLMNTVNQNFYITPREYFNAPISGYTQSYM